MTDDDARQLILREVGPAEHLVWAGAPREGLVLRPSDAAMIPFSLMWGGFTFFWEASVIQSNAPFFFRLWGIPFVAAGIYLIVGRFFVDAYMRKRMAYGFTDQRVIILSGGWSGVKSLPLDTLSDLTLTEKGDGSGTITLGPASPWAAYPLGLRGYRAPAAPAFEFIENARQVYTRLREAQAAT